jgi:outer membrane protein assembly factor BamA
MTLRNACRTAALAACLTCGAAAAQTEEAEYPVRLPTFAELEAAGAVIGRIRVNPQQIFDLDDPRESGWFYRLANQLHILTRPETIERRLLFKSGDYVSVRVIDETERLLRSGSFLHDVQIRPLAYDGEVVDIEVLTRDSWSLEVGASVARSGGVNSSRSSLKEQNFLGSGVSVGLGYSTNVDRAGTELSFQDSNLFGTRTALSASYANLTDGAQWAFGLARPFYSLDTQQAMGYSASHNDVVTGIYEQGVRVSQYRSVSDSWDVYGGWSPGRMGDWTNRYSVGMSKSSATYEVDPEHPPPSRLPADLTLTGPYVRFEAIEDVYEKVRNRDQIGRAEFFAKGFQSRAQLGRSFGTLGSTESSWLYSAAASKGFGSARVHALFFSGAFSGRLNGGERVNQLISGSARYYLPHGSNALFTASFSGDVYRRPDVPAPLQLGGDNGLRGYPLNFQSGERRALLTLEERVYADWHPYRLLRVGGAIFFDAGRAWNGPDAVTAGQHVLTDMGFGMRITDSRSSMGSVLHLDLAFPLNARDQVRSVQFIIKSQSSF